MLRIGIAGADSSHAGEFARHLRGERYTDRVVIVTREKDAPALEALGSIPDEVVPDDAAFIEGIDMALVTHRDAANRAEFAERLLAAGRAVFVDKQLAPDPRSALRLLRVASRTGALLEAGSALRWAPAVRAQAERHRRDPLPRLTLRGPADPRDPRGGLAFYGVHLVEAALEILGDPPPEAARLRGTSMLREGRIEVDLLVAGTQVLLSFEPPDPSAEAPFQIGPDADSGPVSIDLGDNYLRPVLDSFLATAAGRRAPSSETRLLSPVAMMEAIVRRMPSSVRARREEWR